MELKIILIYLILGCSVAPELVCQSGGALAHFLLRPLSFKAVFSPE